MRQIHDIVAILPVIIETEHVQVFYKCF